MKIALIYPELLGTYGDFGNALALSERSLRRGIHAEVLRVAITDDLPEADLYLLGGGEDGPQRLAADLLRKSPLRQRVANGAHVFAVCAGLQLLGTSFSVEGDDAYEGLSLVDVATTRGEVRSVGELFSQVGQNKLVGFENHGGVTSLGKDIAPLGSVLYGRGNDGHHDGFVTDQIWASYAHGPVLAMNPWLCDEVIAKVTGTKLSPLSTVADKLYEERVTSLSSR